MGHFPLLGRVYSWWLYQIKANSLAPCCFISQEQRAKVRVIVVSIKTLSLLEESYYAIGKGGSHNLIHHFEHPLRQDSSEEQRRRNDAPEGYADKDKRVYSLTHEC